MTVYTILALFISQLQPFLLYNSIALFILYIYLINPNPLFTVCNDNQNECNLNVFKEPFTTNNNTITIIHFSVWYKINITSYPCLILHEFLMFVCLTVLHQDKETGFHRGFCWVGFTTEEGVNNALQKEPHMLEGAKVNI